jgi:hypothetical protein
MFPLPRTTQYETAGGSLKQSKSTGGSLKQRKSPGGSLKQSLGMALALSTLRYKTVIPSEAKRSRGIYTFYQIAPPKYPIQGYANAQQ